MDTRPMLAVIAMAIAAASAVAIWAGSIHADIPSQAPGSLSAQTTVTGAAPLSMSSCMAASCHGGPMQPEGHDWKSSYTAWFTRDPHAKAYNDLFNGRSRRMIARLEQGISPGSDEAAARGMDSQAYQAALQRHGCLACHASQAASDSDAVTATNLGCYDCHGPDQGWVQQHYLTNWRQRSDNDRRHAGMADTKDLAGRAAVCVECHIGAPADDNSPLRDMNHDLIAAGHPRLNFEFAAYLANLPPHWDESKDHERLARIHGNVEAEAWLVGQEVSATAALSLLIDRAQRAADESSGRAVWPEFSEYDCYGCHHQLSAPSTRPVRDRQPGQWRWGTWHFSLIEPSSPGLAELNTTIERSWPDPQATVALASRVRLANSTDEPSNARTEMVERLSTIETQNWHWDQFAQWYLGLRALQAACREENRRRNRPASEPQQQLDALLKRLEEKLKFTEHADSPWDFDATDAELVQLVDQVRRILPALGPAADN